MATRMQQRRGTAAQWTEANPILGAGEIGFQTDTNSFKVGDGTNPWADLGYFLNEEGIGGNLDDYIPLLQKGEPNGVAELDANGQIPVSQLGNLIADAPALLDTLEEIAAALGDDADFASKVVPIIKKTATEWTADSSVIPLGTVAYNTTDASFKVGNGLATFATLDHVIQATELYALGLQVDSLDETKADLAGPSFTGTVVLPPTTSVGDVSADEIGHLNGVTSAIQTQIDAKADSAAVSTTYAPLSGPTFTGTVVLPNTTSIGNVDATELAYVNGVTSAIQTQLDAKAPTANPTFTGTVSGVTKAHVGLGNVTNTADADKPVSSATQTALDAKASLAGATFTGNVVLPSTTTIGNVSSTEIGHLDGVTSSVQTQVNAKASLAGATFTGDVTVETNLVVDGNLTISGTTTTVSAQDLVVSDPLIYIGEGNTANLVDLGLVSSFNDGTYQHAGIVRDSSAGKWKIFKGVTDEPTTTINFAQGSLDGLAVGAFEASSAIIGDVSNTELQYLNGVTSAIQTQLDAKSPIANPTFTGTVTVAASGVAFTDGAQTKQGTPSITTITPKTASYTLSNLNERDSIIEISSASATTLTIPSDATVNYPVGTTLDILQTNTGQVTIAGNGGVTVNATPGLKLRTRWSSATLLKRAANTWVVFGDLTA